MLLLLLLLLLLLPRPRKEKRESTAQTGNATRRYYNTRFFNVDIVRLPTVEHVCLKDGGNDECVCT